MTTGRHEASRENTALLQHAARPRQHNNIASPKNKLLPPPDPPPDAAVLPDGCGASGGAAGDG